MRPLLACFAFSFFWAFGGHFKASESRFLDRLTGDLRTSLHIDKLDTVYEYYLEPKDFTFVHYKKLVNEKPYEYPI